jgi:hypothetical protein
MYREKMVDENVHEKMNVATAANRASAASNNPTKTPSTTATTNGKSHHHNHNHNHHSSLVSSIVNTFNNANTSVIVSSSRSSSPSFCSSSFSSSSFGPSTGKKLNILSRNGSINSQEDHLNDEKLIINHLKRSNSNCGPAISNSSVSNNEANIGISCSVRAMANLLNRTSSTRSDVSIKQNASNHPNLVNNLLNFMDNDTSSVFEDNITTSSSVSSSSHSNVNDPIISSTNINSLNHFNKSNRSSISNATNNNLDDYYDSGNANCNGEDLCNLSKLKIHQEEISFNNLLNECQFWIEVKSN